MTFLPSIIQFQKAIGLKGLVLILVAFYLLSGCLYDEAAKTCFDFSADAETTGECSTVTTGGSSVLIASVSPADEIVILINQSLADQVMDSWTLGPENGTVDKLYTFGSFTLGIGNIVRIHAGSGTEADTTTDLYWEGSEHWVSDDTAHLKDATGTIIDTCKNTDPCWGG